MAKQACGGKVSEAGGEPGEAGQVNRLGTYQGGEGSTEWAADMGPQEGVSTAGSSWLAVSHCGPAKELRSVDSSADVCRTLRENHYDFAPKSHSVLLHFLVSGPSR